MPRQGRIEFPGAMYHVMAGGDHSSCCRLSRRARERLPESAEWQEMRVRMLGTSISHD